MSTPSHMSPGGPVDIGILTVISPELDAVRAALGLADDARHKPGANDTTYFFGSVDSALRKRSYSVALAAIGWAGTSSTASLAMQMIERHKPRLVVLVGIAAGMRGKVKIGDVVLCDRVVAYEPAALTVDASSSFSTRYRIIYPHDFPKKCRDMHPFFRCDDTLGHGSEGPDHHASCPIRAN